MSLAQFDDYHAQIDAIPGWFQEWDVRLFEEILTAQIKMRIPGDMLEIGCYHGKSAIAMGLGLREDERLHVCDIFDRRPPGISLEGLNPYQDLTREAFMANWCQWIARAPEVHACPSTELESELHSRFRFIHVDGSHEYATVRHDIHLAASHAAIDGVIAIDDYRTSHTPGVSAAVWEAAGTGWLFPFALSETKLYAAASKASQTLWVEKAACEFSTSWAEAHRIHGLDVLRAG